MSYAAAPYNKRLLERLAALDLPLQALHCSHVQEVQAEVAPESLLEVMTQLRDEETLAFDIMVDVCGVDYLGYGEAEWDSNSSTTGFSRASMREAHKSMEQSAPEKRFAVVYHLLSTVHNHRLRIKTFPVDQELPVVDSVEPIWPTVTWFEREVYDMFGIRFAGHSDLRRILTDYGFEGHPFRKDFPLSGYVEMVYDEESRLVKYQPVDLQERVLVPRAIRKSGVASPISFDETVAEQAQAATDEG